MYFADGKLFAQFQVLRLVEGYWLALLLFSPNLVVNAI